MIGFIIFLVVIGLVAGFLARLLVPGRDSMSVGQTILLGIVGSFLGGFIGYALFHKDGQDGAFQASGLLGSVVGSIVVLLIWRMANGRRPLHH
ncbi:MAG: transglycosylase [Ilumatobacteraceae bacterium]|nr:transglycosylase [Ilumatobacteraceae bacterium]MCU1389233.1 transglycosylase [Ilumatobacteraceae bacterium]